MFRALIRSWGLILAAGVSSLVWADSALVPELPPVAQLLPAHGYPLAVQVLEPAAGDPSVEAVTSGALDGHFRRIFLARLALCDRPLLVPPAAVDRGAGRVQRCDPGGSGPYRHGPERRSLY